MIWKALIISIIPSASFACGMTEAEVRAMYGLIGFGTIAAIAVVVTFVFGWRALKRKTP